MPFSHVCAEHPQWDAPTLDGVMEHLRDEHPGAHLPATDIITWSFVPQAVAQGNRILRRFLCRVCATQVDTTDLERPPYCDEHLEAARV